MKSEFQVQMGLERAKTNQNHYHTDRPNGAGKIRLPLPRTYVYRVTVSVTPFAYQLGSKNIYIWILMTVVS